VVAGAAGPVEAERVAGGAGGAVGCLRVGALTGARVARPDVVALILCHADDRVAADTDPVLAGVGLGAGVVVVAGRAVGLGRVGARPGGGDAGAGEVALVGDGAVDRRGRAAGAGGAGGRQALVGGTGAVGLGAAPAGVAAGGVLGAEVGAAVGVLAAEEAGGAADHRLGAVTSRDAQGGGERPGQEAPPRAGCGNGAGDGIEAIRVHGTPLSEGATESSPPR
jgi:hypothetical protein